MSRFMKFTTAMILVMTLFFSFSQAIYGQGIFTTYIINGEKIVEEDLEGSDYYNNIKQRFQPIIKRVNDTGLEMIFYDKSRTIKLTGGGSAEEVLKELDRVFVQTRIDGFCASTKQKINNVQSSNIANYKKEAYINAFKDYQKGYVKKFQQYWTAQGESYLINAIDWDGSNLSDDHMFIKLVTTEKMMPQKITVFVNGKEASLEGYRLPKDQYFKIRDIAMLVNGTKKQFEVGFDNKNNIIGLSSKTPYTKVGGELTVSGALTAKDVEIKFTKISLDGEEDFVEMLSTGGSSYFNLRDAAIFFDFYISHDEATNIIRIDTTKGYVF